MGNNNPKISVVMSVYNGQRYLKESIKSILHQTFRDFEFIVVNDASADQSGQILEYYAERDSRVRLIVNPQNFGLTKSLNKAISQARGQYVVRMDDDDIALPARLEKQFEFMEKNPKMALCGALALVINERGEEIGKKDLETNHQDIKKKLLFNNQFIHSALFFRKSVLDSQGLYNETFQRAQDYELVLRMASKYPVANLPEYLIKWRERAGSLSFSGTKQQRCAIRARWWAITKYGYPKIPGIFHIIARLGWLLMPRAVKARLCRKRSYK